MALNEYNIKDITDFDLVQACCAGDDRCFNELVMRYKNLVYSVILRMINDREEANDLAQEVFIKIYRNLDKYRPEFKFSTWVIRIATNHVIDFRRKKKQDHANIDDLSHTLVAENNDSPERIYEIKEQSQMLTEMVSNLPDMYRVPIVLYHQQGLSYQEISEIIEEPLSKVKNRIFRGRKMLKEVLETTMKGGESYV